MNSKYMCQIESLYLQMFDLLFCYARASVENDCLAEEAVQETFQIACQRSEELFHSDCPEGWIVNTLKNVIRNNRRKQESAQQVLTAYLSIHTDAITYSADSIHVDLLYGNIVDMEEFELLKEMAIDGRSYQEMASKRGISIDTCRKRVQRAKEKLRKKIKI